MHSSLPKVLHRIGGEPLLVHVIRTAKALIDQHGGEIRVVTGHGSEQVNPLCTACEVAIVPQSEQLGTGHAARLALDGVSPQGTTVVLYGDVPLIRPHHLWPLLEEGQSRLAVLTADLVDPLGYGRIVRSAEGEVIAIVEEKDASAAQRRITEINSGIYAGPTALFQDLLARIQNDNVQAEYYLTDCVQLTVADGRSVAAIPGPEAAVLGVNTRTQLADLEMKLQHERRQQLMDAGVTMIDPNSVYVLGQVNCEPDVVIHPNVTLAGHVHLGGGSEIGFGSHLTNVTVARDVLVKPYVVMEGAQVGEACQVGPFARLRPGTELSDHCHIGNFVETKNVHFGSGSKANHLSYLGDADVGAGSNIGAGTITCNYDGAHKHRTHLGDAVFVGSNTSLVAPISIGDGATIGAGSVITENVAPGHLAIARPIQSAKANYQRPQKDKE